MIWSRPVYLEWLHKLVDFFLTIPQNAAAVSTRGCKIKEGSFATIPLWKDYWLLYWGLLWGFMSIELILFGIADRLSKMFCLCNRLGF